VTDAWAIYRELAHSPGRETDDALILRAVAEKLEARGFSVAMKSPEDVIDEPSAPPLVLVMCEQLPILETLRRWEERGSLLINKPAAIFETYRHRMIAAFQRENVPMPLSSSPPFPLWVKRADVHATQEGDVQYAADEAALEKALANFKARGIEDAVLQQHVDGDLIKFYGAGDWFVRFYHKQQTLRGYAFDEARLRAIATHAAAVLGVEVFGGDAIADANGDLWIIDLNAWPSFALFREEASERIAMYVEAAQRQSRKAAQATSSAAVKLCSSESSNGE